MFYLKDMYVCLQYYNLASLLEGGICVRSQKRYKKGVVTDAASVCQMCYSGALLQDCGFSC